LGSSEQVRPLSFPVLTTRFLESSRGQIVQLLRRAPRSVEELRVALELTDNAIRNHLSSLERDGIVVQVGVRRTTRAGKPAVLFELHPDAATLLSSAYPPVLGAMMDVLTDVLSPDQTQQVLEAVGKRLAATQGSAATSASTESRLQRATGVLQALGGDVQLLPDDPGYRIQGSGCPLSSVVAAHPETCKLVEALVSQVSGIPVQSRCEHGPRPKCCFSTEAG
jgi:predicted ArsR family transcriptional regulator